MTSLFFADLVRETSDSNGTGAFALLGPTPGHRAFVDAVPQGAAFHYAICGLTHENQREVGVGQMDSSGHLLRQPLSSSNADDLVDFQPGLKTVALVVAADWFAERDALQHQHGLDEVTGLVSALAGKQPLGSYAATLHGHSIADVSKLQQQLDGKQPVGNYALSSHTHNYWPVDGAGNLILGTGRLGIGVSSPQGALDISGPTSRFDSTGARTIRISRSGGSDSNTAVEIGRASDSWYFGVASSGPFAFSYNDPNLNSLAELYIAQNGDVYPGSNNVQKLGTAANRWSVVFAGTGAINTSDERAKCWRGAAKDREHAAAMDILAELGFFQWNDAIAEKGAEQARLHFGVRAQSVWRIMARHGLIENDCDDAAPTSRYAFLCADPLPREAGSEGGTIFGIRSEQLNAFLLAALARHIGVLSGK